MTGHATQVEEHLTEVLVDYTAGFEPSTVDARTRDCSKRALLDLFGTMLMASSPRYLACSILEEFVRHEGGRPVASLVGRSSRTSPTLGALYNGTLAYYCDNEPHHPATVMHAAAAVVPAALATGEAEEVPGEAFLIASILGMDVACRISAALNPRALYARGFHPTSVAGVFGAAAASGYLLRLGRDQWKSAFGLAGLQACGLLAWASDHTEHSRPLNPGLAARNGVTAATLASLDFGGPPAILDEKYDIFRAFSGVRSADGLTDNLGRRFAPSEFAIKIYACCAFLHPGLDALLSLMAEGHLTIRDIESIDLHFPRSGASIIDSNELKSHNAQYILSVAALNGGVSIDDILTDRLAHPDIARLSRNVRVVYDDDLDREYPEQYSSIVVVRTHDGQVMSKRVDWPRGHPNNPLADEELMNKYVKMATRRCTPDQASRISELTLNLEQVSNVRALGDALSLQG